MANPQGVDVASLLSNTSEYIQQVGQTTANLQAVDAKGAAIANASADLYKTIGDSAIIIDSAKQNAELNVQAAKAKAANALGTDITQQTELITSLSQEALTQRATKSELYKTIQEKQSVGLFDDPLGWLLNKFTINDDIAKFNAASMGEKIALDDMNVLNQATQSAMVTQGALFAPITQASVKASADKLASEAAIKANEERLKGLVYNAESIKAAMNGDKEILNARYSAFGAEKQQQQVEISLAHLELSRQEFNWKKLEKEKGEDADKYLIDKLNAGGRARMGESYVPIPYGSAKANGILQLLKSNSPAGKQFQEDYMIGDQSLAIDPSGNTRVLATSPARAVEILQTMPVKLSPAQEPVKKLLDQALQDVAATLQTNPKLEGGKNKAAVAEAINARAKELLAAQAKNVKFDDPSNVFAIPNVKTLVANSPVVANLPVVQKVLAPALAAGASLEDPNQVFALTAQALRDKKISYPEALEINTIYHVGQSANIAARQLPSLGFAPIYSYNVKVDTNPNATFGASEVIDMTRGDQLGRAFNKYLSNTVSPFTQGFMSR